MRLSFLPKSLAPFAGSIKPGAPSAPPAGESSAPAPPRSRALARFAGISAILAASATVLVSLGSHSIETRAVAPKVGAPVLKPADDGGHVRWHTAAVDVVVDKSFSDLAGDDLLSAALDAWRVSGAVLPSVSTLPGEERKVGYDPDGPNENVVVYAPNGWTKANGALAVTVLTYETTSGRIVDADLLVNGGGRLFERFDHDESDPNSDPVSIEHSSGGSGTETTPKTARFDLQSVVTHELGHFFGLGEDYDDGSTTMYYRTRAGEIHKRLITKGDSDVIGALYAEGASDTTPSGDVGCGRSQLARGRGSPPSWMGLAVAALGLALLGIARRARTEQVRVRALAPRRRVGARRWARFGGWLSGFGFIALLAPVKLDAAPDVQRLRGDADVDVIAVAPRWADGIIETELTLRVASCRIAQCPQADQHTVVAGGTLGGVTQVVGPFAVPAVGARLGADLRALGALQIFNPTMKR